ncbi:hypothetical protein C8F01DRAFT_1130029, partial [Mycena amicta]
SAIENTVPVLPQELVDSILGDVQNPTSLKQCSLVSPSFREPAQRLLFRDLSVMNDASRLRQLCDFLLENPRVADFVHNLRLDSIPDVESGGFEAAIQSLEACLPVIVSCAVKLTSLHLDSSYNHIYIPASLIQQLAAAIARVPLTDLQFTRYTFDSAGELRKVLSASPSVQSSGPPVTDRAQISTLAILWPNDSLSRCITKIIDFDSLRVLEVTPEPLAHVLLFARNVQELAIELYDRNVRPAIDLSVLNRLRKLSIYVESQDPTALSYIVQDVISHPPNSLRDIELTLSLSELFGFTYRTHDLPTVIGNAAFDAVFESAAYSSVALQRFAVVLQCWEGFNEQILAAAEEITSKFPFMHRKRLLEVVYEFGSQADERRVICERAT